MRAETSLLGSSSSFGPGNNKADNTTENQLVQGLKNNPQQKYDPFARRNEEFWKNEDKNYKNISQIPTDEEIRRAQQEVEQGYATSRESFNSSQKQAQMNYMWNKHETNNQKADLREKKVISEYLSTERTNSDDQMREALARFKAEQERITGPEKQAQMESDWGQYEVGNRVALQKKEERAEQRSSPESTSSFALTSQFSSSPQGLASQEKQKQVNELWVQNEKGSLLSSQLTRTQEALNLAQKTGDRNLVAILEEQEKNLLELISQNPLTAGISTQEKIDIGKINIERQTTQEKKLNIPDHLVQDVKFVEIQNDQDKKSTMKDYSVYDINFTQEDWKRMQENKEKIQEPSEDTLAKLHELGVDYNELIKISPNFVNLSEGQQAYVLFKAQEQSVEHIQEKADEDFENKRKQSGFLKKLFSSGTMRREANRNAVNTHKGLDAFGEDISRLSKHISENEWDINIREDGTYQIEYFKAPEGISAKDKQLFDNYNIAATALSDVPYEWSLPTASKNEKKAYQAALKAFDQNEKVLRKELEENGEEHPEILARTFNYRSQIELNQLFSSYPDISSKLNDMKNASFRSELTKKILNPALVGTGLGLGAQAGARVISKALYGLGGAAGASFAIGAFLGWRRKNSEFEEDTKAVRRGKELKETGDKVFGAKQNAERIAKLLSKIENEQNPERREKSLLALEDRLQILDKRLKKGRVNFGTAKEQLENKSLLMEAMTQAQVYRYQLSQEAEPINKRITDYFDKQDKKSKNNRNKARVSAAVLGGLTGAGSATAAWMIADYFKGGETSAKILGALKEGMQEAGDSIKDGLGNLQESMQRGAEEIGQSMRDGWNGVQDNIQSGIDRMVPGQPWFPHGVPGTINPGIETNIPTDPIQNPGFKSVPGMGAGKEAWEAINNLKNATNFEVSVDASSKGAIETFENLQREILQKYPDPTQAPQNLQEFLAKSPTQHAIDENFYRPGDPSGNESAKIFKGGKLGFNQVGELVYTDARNGIDMLSGEGKFDGEHFDFGGNQEAKVPAQEFASEPSSPTTPTNPEVPVTPEKLTGEIEHVKLSKNLSVDFEITEDKQGKLQSTFHNIKLDQFDSYHKAYLKQNLEEYSQKIFQSPEFQVEHGEAIRDNVITPETISNDLKNLTNQMIVRDQILQEGGLNPDSQEYKILKGERDALRKIIENNFEAYDQKGELLYNVEGKKYPDPNYLFGQESSSTSTNSSEGPGATENLETTAKPKLESVVVRNNVINQDFNFKFEKTPEGKLIQVYIDKSSSGTAPNEYFEKRLGFNPDWRKASGLAQTFEDSVPGKKLIEKIEIAKVALIGYDSFAPGTPEHELFKNTLSRTIQDIETNYPEVFEYKN